MNRSNIMVKAKSKAPKNKATKTVKPSTMSVFLMVSCLVGQFTLFASTFTSLKNEKILLNMLVIGI